VRSKGQEKRGTVGIGFGFGIQSFCYDSGFGVPKEY